MVRNRVYPLRNLLHPPSEVVTGGSERGLSPSEPIAPGSEVVTGGSERGSPHSEPIAPGSEVVTGGKEVVISSESNFLTKHLQNQRRNAYLCSL